MPYYALPTDSMALRHPYSEYDSVPLSFAHACSSSNSDLQSDSDSGGIPSAGRWTSRSPQPYQTYNSDDTHLPHTNAEIVADSVALSPANRSFDQNRPHESAGNFEEYEAFNRSYGRQSYANIGLTAQRTRGQGQSYTPSVTAPHQLQLYSNAPQQHHQPVHPSRNAHRASSNMRQAYVGGGPGTVDPHALDHPHTTVHEAEQILRSRLSLPNNIALRLAALPDPVRPEERPSAKLGDMVMLSLWEAPRGRLTLQEIYSAIQARFPYYRNPSNEKWKGSIRHLLSLQGIFRNVERPIAEPGKGSYWELDFVTNPCGLKRVRKRNPKNNNPNTTTETDDEEEYSSGTSSVGSSLTGPFDAMMRQPQGGMYEGGEASSSSGSHRQTLRLSSGSSNVPSTRPVASRSRDPGRTQAQPQLRTRARHAQREEDDVGEYVPEVKVEEEQVNLRRSTRRR